ncbi:DUF2752 domain-containing protein [Arenimonas sp.]|uniref:DUF2752 domain-containing protein n=1 Tax=Arenimonas sp. TaxID=1872635 RepID=UPI0039E43429
MQASSAPRWALPALAALAIAGVAVLWRVDPNQPGSGLPPCPIHAYTGLFCPGCGATRAMHALVHGDLPQALAMNPVFTLALPLVLLLVLDKTTRLPPMLSRWALRISDARPWAVLLLGFAFLRNLPWPPFNLLAPG